MFGKGRSSAKPAQNVPPTEEVTNYSSSVLIEMCFSPEKGAQHK